MWFEFEVYEKNNDLDGKVDANLESCHLGNLFGKRSMLRKRGLKCPL